MAQSLSAQTHWVGHNFEVVPVWAIPGLDPIAANAVANLPNASINGYWTSEGNIVRINSLPWGVIEPGGGWISTLSVGVQVGPVTVSADFSKEVHYRLEFVQLENGEAAIVLFWTKRDYNGNIIHGETTIRKIVQSQAGETIQVVSTSGGGTYVPHATTVGLNAITSNGQWVTVELFSTKSFMGADGKFYVIGTTKRVTYWVPAGGEWGGGGYLE